MDKDGTPISSAELEYFNSPSKGRLNFRSVVEDIILYIKEQPDRKYQVVVGTDSAASTETDFVTAVVVRRIGAGGRYFWQRSGSRRFYQQLDKQRIHFEVERSINIALAISQKLKEHFKETPPINQKGISFSYHFMIEFEVHIDVGENGPTKEMIKEVVGMVTGMGFNAKTKPESFAASAVADRHT